LPNNTGKPNDGEYRSACNDEAKCCSN